MDEKEKLKKIIELLNDDETSFDTFYQYLRSEDTGEWDGVNSEETIKQYCTEKIDEGIHVSHIIEALENNPSEEELYKIWLGNSMNTPEPIKTKKQLLEALNINVPKI